jgi:hypothetical protein
MFLVIDAGVITALLTVGEKLYSIISKVVKRRKALIKKSKQECPVCPPCPPCTECA